MMANGLRHAVVMGGVKMSRIGRVGRAAIIFAHALIGWAYCGALISLFYFRKFSFTMPIPTPLLFLSMVVALISIATLATGLLTGRSTPSRSASFRGSTV
jgi:hypothetical protein